MGTMLSFTAARTIGIVEEPDRPLAPREVRLRTLFSGISAGTELTAYRGSNPYLHKRWEPAQRLFVADERTAPAYPLPGWGYEECGEVVELGADAAGVALGQRVYGTWGHKTHAIVDQDYAQSRMLPDNVDAKLGIFSQIGAIALNAILDAQINLGETITPCSGLVWSASLSRSLRGCPARSVIGVDLLETRRELARTLGTATVIDAHGAAEMIKDLTAGRGADVCIEASGATPALHEAIRACAYSAKVIAMGFYQGEGRGLFLGEEFHHNRINIVGSQISGISPDLKYRWDTARLVSTFMGLVADGRLDLAPLITHVAPFGAAADLFDLLDRHPEQVVQAVIAFAEA